MINIGGVLCGCLKRNRLSMGQIAIIPDELKILNRVYILGTKWVSICDFQQNGKIEVTKLLM